jgi:hypothetical protein
MRRAEEVDNTPEAGEIYLDSFQLGVGRGKRAILRTKGGFIVWIVAPCMAEETGEFIIHEYLDELGYDTEVRKDA